jgi:hypothetical protein
VRGAAVVPSCTPNNENKTNDTTTQKHPCNKPQPSKQIPMAQTVKLPWHKRLKILEKILGTLFTLKERFHVNDGASGELTRE